MHWWGSLGSYRYPWVIAWLVPAWSVVWSCALGGLAVPVMSRSWVEHWRGYCGDDESDWDFSRYRMHCSLGLWFSCLAWKFYMGSPLPRLALGRGGGGLAALLMRLVCWTGWAACQVINWKDHKCSGGPHSTCLVRAMWPDWQCSPVSKGSCAFCYSCHDLQQLGLKGSNRYPWFIAWLVPA